jgi:hypothetical protein
MIHCGFQQLTEDARDDFDGEFAQEPVFRKSGFSVTLLRNWSREFHIVNTMKPHGLFQNA